MESPAPVKKAVNQVKAALINGSSLSVHVAAMTVAGPGDTIVPARNGHKSVVAGLILSGARPVWVDPYYDEALEVALGPLPQDLAAALDAHPEARAGMVFTPSSYGTSADVRALAEEVVANGGFVEGAADEKLGSLRVVASDA